jgi:transposase
MSEEVRFSTRQKRALAALLVEKSTRDAAASVGLSEKTLYRYLQDPAFQGALKQAQDDLTRDAVRRLTAGLGAALGALEELIAGDDATNRRLAAVAWLTQALKLREFAELERRISELEARIS